MSHDRIDEAIKAKIGARELEHKVNPDQADDLWSRLQEKSAVKARRRWPVMLLRAAAALLVLVGAYLLFLRPGREASIAHVQQQMKPQQPLALSHHSPDTAKRVVVVRKSQYPGTTLQKVRKISRPGLLPASSIVKAAAQLRNIDDPTNTARQEIEMIAVKDGETTIKDHIEF